MDQLDENLAASKLLRHLLLRTRDRVVKPLRPVFAARDEIAAEYGRLDMDVLLAAWTTEADGTYTGVPVTPQQVDDLKTLFQEINQLETTLDAILTDIEGVG